MKNIYFISASNSLLSLSISLCCFQLRRQKVLQNFGSQRQEEIVIAEKTTRISSNPTQWMNKKTELSNKVTDSFSKSRKCSAIFRSHVNRYSKIPSEEPLLLPPSPHSAECSHSMSSVGTHQGTTLEKDQRGMGDAFLTVSLKNRA